MILLKLFRILRGLGTCPTCRGVTVDGGKCVKCIRSWVDGLRQENVRLRAKLRLLSGALVKPQRGK
jgi:hypothetical protein